MALLVQTKLGMQHANTHNTQCTNPGTPNARKGYNAPSTVAVLAPGVGSNWGTMVKVGNKAYTVQAIHTNAQGMATAYTVVTQAGMVATIGANHCPQGTYTGYAVTGAHWGACKLATGLGMVPGLNRYAQ